MSDRDRDPPKFDLPDLDVPPPKPRESSAPIELERGFSLRPNTNPSDIQVVRPRTQPPPSPKRTTAAKIRIAILLGILVFVILYAVRDVRRRSARNDWERTLDVAIVLVNDGTANQHAIESLSMRAPALADRLTVEARRYAPQALPPFRFVVKGPILASSPPDPPADGAWNHVQYAWDLASYTRKVDASADLDADLFDSRIYVTLHGGSLAGSSVEGASQANGRVGIVKVDLDPEMVDTTLFVIAHELFHTLGATDKYDAMGHCAIPDGLPEPTRAPLYPQPFAELMARNRAVGPGVERIPTSLSELAVGLKTAREIGWR